MQSKDRFEELVEASFDLFNDEKLLKVGPKGYARVIEENQRKKNGRLEKERKGGGVK